MEDSRKSLLITWAKNFNHFILKNKIQTLEEMKSFKLILGSSYSNLVTKHGSFEYMIFCVKQQHGARIFSPFFDDDELVSTIDNITKSYHFILKDKDLPTTTDIEIAFDYLIEGISKPIKAICKDADKLKKGAIKYAVIQFILQNQRSLYRFEYLVKPTQFSLSRMKLMHLLELVPYRHLHLLESYKTLDGYRKLDSSVLKIFFVYFLNTDYFPQYISSLNFAAFINIKDINSDWVNLVIEANCITSILNAAYSKEGKDYFNKQKLQAAEERKKLVKNFYNHFDTFAKDVRVVMDTLKSNDITLSEKSFKRLEKKKLYSIESHTHPDLYKEILLSIKKDKILEELKKEILAHKKYKLRSKNKETKKAEQKTIKAFKNLKYLKEQLEVSTGKSFTWSELALEGLDAVMTFNKKQFKDESDKINFSKEKIKGAYNSKDFLSIPITIDRKAENKVKEKASKYDLNQQEYYNFALTYILTKKLNERGRVKLSYEIQRASKPYS